MVADQVKKYITVLLLVVSLPVRAGVFDTLFDGCGDLKKSLKVGDEQSLTVKTYDINSDGEIDMSRYSGWGAKDKIQIKGNQINQIKALNSIEDLGSVEIYSTITQMDGTKSIDSCFVMANFTRFGEDTEKKRLKYEQKKQCRIDFEALPEEVGSLSKLKEIGTRCVEYSPNSNWSVFFLCGQLEQCHGNDKEVVAKFNRIAALERNQLQNQSNDRKAELIAGRAKIQNLQDAELVYQSDEVEPIIKSPLLTPDGKIYTNETRGITVGVFTLDAEEKSNLLRVKVIWGEDSYGVEQFDYIFLRTNAKTVFFNLSKLRIGGQISILGRYVSNVTYTTLSGAKKVAPALDVMYIEEKP